MLMKGLLRELVHEGFVALVQAIYVSLAIDFLGNVRHNVIVQSREFLSKFPRETALAAVGFGHCIRCLFRDFEHSFHLVFELTVVLWSEIAVIEYND